MKSVMQTLFYDASLPIDDRRGNCWAACLASLIEIPITEIPDFVGIDLDGGENWWTHTHRFLAERGYRLETVEPPRESFYIQCGLSPRAPDDDPDILHSVIFRAGSLAHDPHPDRTGIKSIEDAYRVVKT